MNLLSRPAVAGIGTIRRKGLPPGSGAPHARCRRILAIFAFAVICSAVSAQNPSGTADAIPNAPSVQPSETSPANTGAISGTVLNQAGGEVPGARVVLEDSAGTRRELRANSSGAFTFSGLPAGTFRITASSPEWGTYTSPPIQLAAGSFQIVPGVVLPVTTATTSVRVYGNPDVLSEQQVQIAVQQRVLGVFPNFYSSYDWNAPPMHSRQKFQLALRSLVDPLTFLEAGGVAGAEQYVNRFPGYGSGAEGYVKRYGAAYADHWSGRMFSDAIFPSLFHQDPRYFYRGEGSTKSRALYAMSAAVMARGDNGNWEPNYSNILGGFAAGAVSNLYYPASDRGGSLVVTNGLISIASDAASNLVREFVLKRFTTRGEEGSH